MYRIGAASLFTAVVLLLPTPLAAQNPPGLKELLGFEEALQQVIQQLEPSIACILVSRSDDYRRVYNDVPPPDRPGELGGFPPSPPRPPPPGSTRPVPDGQLNRLDLADRGNVPESYGSGVVLDEAGLILTNYHVVRDARKVYVRLPGDKGSYANIYAADPRSDLAVLRLIHPPADLKPIKFGDGGAVRKGQIVLALAHPFAAGFRDGSPSVSWGIVSNLRRRAPSRGNEDSLPARQEYTMHHYGTLIQTDARLHAGCSGGALVNLRGEMIGLTTALAALIDSETAGGFAVAMERGIVRIIEDKLKKGEEVEYGFLGVSLRGPDGRNPGLLIDRVTEGSPAWLAGLRSGHTILAVDGVPIREMDDLFLQVGMRLAGTEVRLEVQVDSAPKTVKVKLAKYFVAGKVIATNRVPAVRGLRVDYVSVLQQKRDRSVGPSPRFAPTTNQGGVFVSQVLPDSPAMRARLQENDVITHVNEVSVASPTEFYQAVQDIHRKQGQSAPIELTLANPDWHKPVAKVRLE